MAANATELYLEMLDAIKREQYQRLCTDPESPCPYQTLEAPPGGVFTLNYCEHNLVGCVPVDIRWATANVLHFFAATEDAGCLASYNQHAARFLTEGKWIGAYGAIAMPQIEGCIERLKVHPMSRRAIVSMGDYAAQDINRPACWSFLQFLVTRKGLELIVFQRSLNLVKIMPLDVVVLTNVLLYAAKRTNIEPGPLRWVFGSLHAKLSDLEIPLKFGQRNTGIVIPVELASNPGSCLAKLYEGL